MDIALKTVCSIRARSLQRRLFRAHLEEAEAQHIDLLLHTDVRWLSKGRFLERFRELLPDIKKFITQFEDGKYAQIENEQWLFDLTFLTDLTALLNELKLELHEKEKNIVNMISFVNSFKRKLQLLSTKLQLHDLRYFQHMNSKLVLKSKTPAQFNSARYFKQVQSLSSELDKRSIDFASVEPIATYISLPFATDIGVEDIASKIRALFQLNITAMENKILSLQNDINMKSRSSTKIWKIWKMQLE